MSNYNYRRNNNRNQNNATPSQTTSLFNTPDEGIERFYAQVPNNAISVFRMSGYEVTHIGIRSTKNKDVTMWRIYVKVSPKHAPNVQKSNAATLVRAILPAVGEISFYKPEFEALDTVCVVFFVFQPKPRE